MKEELLLLLVCPECHQGLLKSKIIKRGAGKEIIQGIVFCSACSSWYPIQNGLLELLTPSFSYIKSRRIFSQKHLNLLRKLTLQPNLLFGEKQISPEIQQRNFFDRLASNSVQSYLDFEQQPFWQAIDQLTLADWTPKIKPNTWLLDIGCAQGRSIKHLIHLPIHIVAFDISKKLVEQALKRYPKSKAKLHFFVGNAADKLPFADQTFDYVLVYGVLHHLTRPKKTCREIARILKPSGYYFGCENNASVLRSSFEVLQKLLPIWKEEAGKEPTLSSATLHRYFKNTLVRVTTKTTVFLPPHLINVFSVRLARQLLSFTNRLCGSLPFLKNHGGLITVQVHLEKSLEKLNLLPAGQRRFQYFFEGLH